MHIDFLEISVKYINVSAAMAEDPGACNGVTFSLRELIPKFVIEMAAAAAIFLRPLPMPFSAFVCEICI